MMTSSTINSTKLILCPPKVEGRDTPKDTPARLSTVRIATTAEVKRVLVYLLARLRVEHDLA
jgi:hypothetical protein